MAAFNFTSNNYSDRYLCNRTDLPDCVNNHMDDEPRKFVPQIVVLFQMERILSSLGLILNVSTIVILLSMKEALKTQFKLILSLAISDFLLDALHFIQTFYFFSTIFFPYVLTKGEINLVKILLTFLYTTAQYAGLGTMCTIAVDILLKVRKPFRYQVLMSKKRGNIIITCLWLIPALVLFTTTIILYALNTIDFTSTIYVYILGSVFYCFLCLLFFFIFIAIYSMIFYSVRVSVNKIHGSNRRNTTKMAVTFFLILISFFVCTLSGICIILIGMSDIDSDGDLFSLSVACLYTLNTLLDPIIYAVRIPEIRARYCAFYRGVCIRSVQSE